MGLSASATSYDLLRLTCVRGLGPKRIRQVLTRLSRAGLTLDALLSAARVELSRELGLPAGLADAVYSLDQDECYRLHESLLRRGIKMVGFEDREYPSPLLSRLGDAAPPLLFTIGRSSLLNTEGIAVIGARNAGPAVLQAVQELAAGLAELGWNVVSGYAKGVDAAAHLGALGAGGTTSAVLSCGILEFAPSRTFKDLEWKRHAVAVSQFMPSAKWTAGQAMARNATVAGMASGVVVAQSGAERDDRGRMSGTFAAASSALSQGVPVLVLSPSVMSGDAVGNEQLIQMGGTELNGPNYALQAIEEVLALGARDPLGQTSLDLE